MRFSTSAVLPALGLAGVTAAQGTRQPSALVNVEIQSGGTPQSSTNITVPLDDVFTDEVTLAKVSKLSLVGATDAPIDDISCQPYKGTEGTGIGPLPFDKWTPSHISTNTEVVGSIVCSLAN